MRYDQLKEIIKKIKPRTICEIGTWNGNRAIEMITCARDAGVKNIYYEGYDLFENYTSEIDSKEFNVKPHHNTISVNEKLSLLSEKIHGFTFKLIPGNTNETLNEKKFDIAFIDGGHSIETIRNDFEKLKGSGMVVLDDYYIKDGDGKIPDISKVGCNFLEKEYKLKVLPKLDNVKGGGLVAFAVYESSSN